MMRPFGVLLKERRLQANFGLRKFAEAVGMQASNLSDVEHGRRQPPAEAAKITEMAEVLGLRKESAEWSEFFDAARAAGELPADVRHLADRKLVPALLRTIDNRQLTDGEIEQLIAEVQDRARERGNGD